MEKDSPIRDGVWQAVVQDLRLGTLGRYVPGVQHGEVVDLMNQPRLQAQKENGSIFLRSRNGNVRRVTMLLGFWQGVEYMWWFREENGAFLSSI